MGNSISDCIGSESNKRGAIDDKEESSVALEKDGADTLREKGSMMNEDSLDQGGAEDTEQGDEDSVETGSEDDDEASSTEEGELDDTVLSASDSILSGSNLARKWQSLFEISQQFHLNSSTESCPWTLRADDETDYRAFCVLLHPRYGILLLHCTRKSNKGPHYQLPGGHVDKDEFDLYDNNLYQAAQAGAARELYEETGIDLRHAPALDRLLPLVLHPEYRYGIPTTSSKKPKQFPLPNMFKSRLFFIAVLSEDEFFKKAEVKRRLTRIRNHGLELFLPLSVEHSGFWLESSSRKAVDLLQLHSGGKVSKALKMALDTAQEHLRSASTRKSPSPQKPPRGNPKSPNSKTSKEDSPRRIGNKKAEILHDGDDDDYTYAKSPMARFATKHAQILDTDDDLRNPVAKSPKMSASTVHSTRKAPESSTVPSQGDDDVQIPVFNQREGSLYSPPSKPTSTSFMEETVSPRNMTKTHLPSPAISPIEKINSPVALSDDDGPDDEIRSKKSPTSTNLDDTRDLMPQILDVTLEKSMMTTALPGNTTMDEDDAIEDMLMHDFSLDKSQQSEDIQATIQRARQDIAGDLFANTAENRMEEALMRAKSAAVAAQAHEAQQAPQLSEEVKRQKRMELEVGALFPGGPFPPNESDKKIEDQELKNEVEQARLLADKYSKSEVAIEASAGTSLNIGYDGFPEIGDDPYPMNDDVEGEPPLLPAVPSSYDKQPDTVVRSDTSEEEEEAVHDILDEFITETHNIAGRHSKAITTSKPPPVPKAKPVISALSSSPEKKGLRGSYMEIAKVKREREEFTKQRKTDVTYEQLELEANRLLANKGLAADSRLRGIEKAAPPSPRSPATSNRVMVPLSPSGLYISPDRQGGTSFILLMSQTSGNPTQRSNQEKTLVMLQCKKLPFSTVDGSDPFEKERRDQLFEISGIRGNYPQLFLQKEHGQIDFVGDFEMIDYMNENGALGDLVSSPSNNISMLQGDRGAPTSMGGSMTVKNGKVLVMLLSTSSGNAVQKANQERAIFILDSSRISPQFVDGSDQSLIPLRNHLFSLSGLRGKYPQFFLKTVATEDYSFVGTFDTIESMNDEGPLEELFGS